MVVGKVVVMIKTEAKAATEATAVKVWGAHVPAALMAVATKLKMQTEKEMQTEKSPQRNRKKDNLNIHPARPVTKRRRRRKRVVLCRI